MRKDLVELVDHAQEFVTGLVTNGRKLAKLAPDLRRVSLLDAADGRVLWRTDVFGWAWPRPAVDRLRLYVSVIGTHPYEIRHLGSLAALDAVTELFENRDYQGSTHFFFDIGHGNLLAFFDFPGLDLGPYAEVLGGLHHLAISVTPERWEHLRAKLADAGVSEAVVNVHYLPDQIIQHTANRTRPRIIISDERDLVLGTGGAVGGRGAGVFGALGREAGMLPGARRFPNVRFAVPALDHSVPEIVAAPPRQHISHGRAAAGQAV